MKDYISVHRDNHINYQQQKGATMIEFALVIGVVLTFILGIIDISLYYHSLTIVRESARRMTTLAVVDSDFATDTRTVSNPTPDEIARVVSARRRIVENSLGIARDSIISNNLADESNNFTYDYSPSGYDNPANSPESLAALLIRPGEVVRSIANRNGAIVQDTNIVHPNCDPIDDSSALCEEQLNIAGNDAWIFMQRNFPFYAQVRARVNTILFGTVEVESRSIAWKDLTGSNRVTDFADVPSPQTCQERYPTVGEQNDLCRTRCGAFLEACEFLPTNNVSIGCTSCRSCDEFTSADEICNTCGGEDGNATDECIFNAAADNSNCGGCQERTGTCSDFTTAAEACEACDNNLEICNFQGGNALSANGDVRVCAGCVPRRGTCSEITTADAACSACGGANGNTNEECQFNGSSQVNLGNESECGDCIERELGCDTLSADQIDTVCNQCDGASGNTDQECVINGVNGTVANGFQECGGCIFRRCDAVNDGISNGEQEDSTIEGCPNCDLSTEVCEFIADNNVSQACFACRPLPCNRRFTQDEVDTLCAEFEEENPDKECQFNAGDLNGNCFGPGRTRTCEERRRDGVIVSQQECRDTCNSTTEDCLQLPGDSRATICTECDPKPCPVDLSTVCGTCDPDTTNCIAIEDADLTSPSCIECRTKGCDEAGVTATDVCGDLGCPVGQTCTFNGNALLGECGGCQECPPVICDITQNQMDDGTGCGCTACTFENRNCQEGQILRRCECEDQDAI